MSTTDYNGYLVEGELTTKDSGFSKWGFAKKDGKEYFIKEFLSPVYPEDSSMFTEKQLKSKMEGCEIFEREKKELYQKINMASSGNATRIKAFFRYGSKYYIVTDKILSIRLQPKNVAELPYTQKELLCKILAYSLMCLHENGVVHADIKWDNILLTQSSGAKAITPKLIDFDNSFLINKPPVDSEDLNLDLVYCAPEAYQFIDEEDVELTEKIDIYALGLIFHQIMTGKLPEIGKEYAYVFKAQLEDAPINISRTLNDRMASIIEGMLEKNPKKRLSAKAVFAALYPKLVDETVKETEIKESKPKETPQPAKYGKYFTPAGDL